MSQVTALAVYAEKYAPPMKARVIKAVLAINDESGFTSLDLALEMGIRLPLASAWLAELVHGEILRRAGKQRLEGDGESGRGAVTYTIFEIVA